MSVKVYSHGRPSVRGVGGMVAAAHPLATMAGVRMLQAGGNAFDAVAATAAALNVAEPYMSGLAGLGLATVYTAHDGQLRSLDFHPPVPRDFDATRLTRAAPEDGPNASGVPGNLAGWCFLAGELGRLPLSQIFAPAIGYARDGIVTSDFFRTMTLSGLDREMQPEWRTLYYDGTAGGRLALRRPARCGEGGPHPVPWRLPVAGRPGGGGTLLGNPDQRPFRRP